MAKKQEAEKEPNHERWLLTYADLITLLMIFFVVMYSMSVVDLKKFQAMAQSLNTVFSGGAGILPGSPAPGASSSSSSGASGSDDLGGMSGKGLSVERMYNQVSLILDERVLFPEGSASFGRESTEQLMAMSKLLRRSKGLIRIEGHTDNIPPRGTQFKTNWQLSATRAANIAQFFAENGVDSRRMVAVGMADSHPKVSNSTPEGRAVNRRVVIVINSAEED